MLPVPPFTFTYPCSVAWRPCVIRSPHADDLNVTVGDSLRSWQHGVNPNGGKKISKALIIWAMIALTVAAADAGVPRRHDAWQTLTGTCTKVTVMDVSADPTVCSDQVATIKFSDGMLGFAFTVRPPGTSKPWIMSFFATRSSRSGAGSDKNAGSLAIHRVYFTIDDKTDDLDATGSCVLSKTYKKGSAKFTCTATTSKGDFAGEFTGSYVAQRPLNASME